MVVGVEREIFVAGAVTDLEGEAFTTSYQLAPSGECARLPPARYHAHADQDIISTLLSLQAIVHPPSNAPVDRHSNRR